MPPTPDEPQEQRGEDDIFPADVQPVLTRLLRDGASWRRSLPPTEALRQQVRALASGNPMEQEQLVSDPTPSAPRTTIPPDQRPPRIAPPRRPHTPRSREHGRVRGVLTGATALVVVVLFVALFGALANRGRTSAGPGAGHTSETTPTPTPYVATQLAPGTLTEVAGLRTTSEPVISPGDPSVAYVIQNQRAIVRVSHGASTPLSLPDVLAKTPFQWLDLAVSPIGNTLFATASLQDSQGNYLTQGCPVSPPVVALGGGNLLASPASGSIPCQVQFVSTDGGQHWQTLHLPNNLILGSANAMTGIGVYSTPPLGVGKRLFGLAGTGPLGTGIVYTLITSADYGQTWHAVSTPFAGNGYACSIAAPASGQTLYALVASQGCSSQETASRYALWAGANDGTIWAQATLPTSDYAEAIAAGGTQGTLYLITANVGDHTGPITASKNLYLSSDQGTTWKQVPSAGLPQAATWIGLGNPVVLTNGALVLPFVQATVPNGVPTLYELQPGGNAWQKLVTLPATRPYTMAAVASLAPGGGEIVSLVQADTPMGSTIHYSVYQYAL